jgi:hypothetical protein
MKTSPTIVDITSLLRRIVCHKSDCLCGNVDVKDLAPEIGMMIKALEQGGRVQQHLDGVISVSPPSRLTN